jgi:hypothetical protein
MERPIISSAKLDNYKVSNSSALPILPLFNCHRYDIDLGASIGQGYFLNVYKGTWHRHTVAVKVLESQNPSNLLREVKIWRPLQHCNVLSFYGASSTESPLPWFLVSLFIQHRSISDYLKCFDWDAQKKRDTKMCLIQDDELD